MRLPAPGCLAIVLLTTLPAFVRAEIHHHSSRLLEVNAGILTGFAMDANGSLFVAHPHAVVRFDAGDVTWTRPITLTPPVMDYAVIMAVAVANDGGALLTGGFRGTIDFGGGAMITPFDDSDVYLLKLNERGEVEWQILFGAQGDQTGRDIAVARNGGIVITGTNALTVNFGGGPITTQGGSGVFVARFDDAGDHVWSRGFESIGTQEGTALALHDDDRIALACHLTSGAIDFGGAVFTSQGQGDVVLAMLDGSGAHVWSRHAFSSRREEARDVAIDSAGNTFVCGMLTRSLDLGGGVLATPSNASINGWAASYDSLGEHRWSFLISDPAFSWAEMLDTDGEGNCVVLGSNLSELIFGNESVSPSDALLLVFDSAGNPLAGKGHPGGVNAPRIFVDRPGDRFLLCTAIWDRVDFGGAVVEPENDSRVALAKVGLRPVQHTTFTQFEARPMDGGVKITWTLAAGSERLVSYVLSRRIDYSSNAQILHYAAATEGESSFLDRTAKPGHQHLYRLTVSTADGAEVISDWVSVTLPSVTNALEQNAPNPFNPVTTFAYSIAEPAGVSIVIYDQSGAVVARLDQGMQPAGWHEASWGGHNMRGELVASGVYFYRLEGVPDVGARKMLLLK